MEGGRSTLNQSMMKIKLTRSGGLAGKIMRAEAEWTLSVKEYESLVKSIKGKRLKTTERKKDAFTYTLQRVGKKESTTIVEPIKIPAKYNSFFKALFASLRTADDE